MRSPTRTTTGKADGGLVRVRVQPRASRDEITGWRDDVLAVRVTAPPVEGEANRAVAALLARALAVRPSAVTVVRGERGREKLVRVEGLAGPELEARLAGSAGARTSDSRRGRTSS